VLQRIAVRRNVLQCVEACCSVSQCVAVCCSVLQCVAVCCSVLHPMYQDSYLEDRKAQLAVLQCACCIEF